MAPRGHDAHLLLEVRERLRVLLEGDAEDLGEALGREVVMRGAETASHDEQVRLTVQRVSQGGRETLAVVGDGERLQHLDAAAAEVVADERAVGVTGAAVEQFVAAQHDGGARRAGRHQSLVPGMWMMPRAFKK